MNDARPLVENAALSYSRRLPWSSLWWPVAAWGVSLLALIAIRPHPYWVAQVVGGVIAGSGFFGTLVFYTGASAASDDSVHPTHQTRLILVGFLGVLGFGLLVLYGLLIVIIAPFSDFQTPG